MGEENSSGIMPPEVPSPTASAGNVLRQRNKSLTAFVMVHSCTELSPPVLTDMVSTASRHHAQIRSLETDPIPTCGTLPVFSISIPIPPRIDPAFLAADR